MKGKSTIRVVKLLVQNNNGQVLAIRRSSTAAVRPLTWDFPGGVIEENESVVDAAIRETFEETGLTVVPGEMLDTVSSETTTALVVESIYQAKSLNSKVILSTEHDKYYWIETELLDMENFPAIFHESIMQLKRRAQ